MKTCFIRRKSDGKYFRGARLWKWSKSWRHAALLTPAFVEDYVYRDKINRNEVEMIKTDLPLKLRDSWWDKDFHKFAAVIFAFICLLWLAVEYAINLCA